MGDTEASGSIPSEVATLALYSMLVNNTPDVLFQSTAGVLEWVSPSVEELSGWAPEELVGTLTSHFMHPDDMPIAVLMRNQVRAGDIGRGTFRFATRDGGYRWFEMSLNAVSHVTATAVGILRDVNARVLTEIALAESEEKFRLLAENSSDVVVHSREGIVRWVSPSVARTFGWTPAELIGSDSRLLVHPHDAERLAERVPSHEPIVARYRLAASDGSFHWCDVNSAPFFNADGETDGDISALRVVDAEVAAEHKLHEVVTEFQLLAQCAADVVYRTNADRKVEWVTPSVVDTLGWTPDELIGTEMFELVHPEDKATISAARESSYSGDPEWMLAPDFEARMLCKDGSYRWMSTKRTPLLNDQGKLVSVISGLRDVSRLVEARELAQTSENLLRAQADALIDPLLLLDPVREDGVIVDFCCATANHAAGIFFGRESHEFVGTRMVASLGGVPRTDLLGVLGLVISSRRPLAIDGISLRVSADSPSRAFDIRATCVGDDQITITWRDVTERVEAEQLIAESEERFRLLAENASDVVLRTRNGEITWASPSLTKTLGWLPTEWVGLPLAAYLQPGDLDVESTVDESIAAEESVQIRYRLRDRNGIYHWVEAISGPYLDAHECAMAPSPLSTWQIRQSPSKTSYAAEPCSTISLAHSVVSPRCSASQMHAAPSVRPATTRPYCSSTSMTSSP